MAKEMEQVQTHAKNEIKKIKRWQQSALVAHMLGFWFGAVVRV